MNEKNTIKISKLCDIINGYAFKSKNYTSDGLRIIRIANVQKGYLEDASPCFYPNDFEGLDKYILKHNDILISLTGNVGRVALMTKKFLPAVLNQRVGCIRVKNKNIIDVDYLFYFLNSDLFESKCIFFANGVAQKNLSTEWLKDVEVPIFPYDKQKKISCILKTISNIINLRRKQLIKLDELVKARFAEMFGDPIKNQNEYPLVSLSEYIDFLTSGSRGWSKYCINNGDEWFITIKNVKNCRITTENMQSVNAPKNAEAQRTRVQEGDLLISITADLGRTGVVSKEIANHGAYINQHLSCIRLKKGRLLPLYAAYFMESPAGKMQLLAKNQNAVKAGLNFDSIKSLRLLVPPFKLQEDFVFFINEVDKSRLAVKRCLEKAEFLKSALTQEYFS